MPRPFGFTALMTVISLSRFNRGRACPAAADSNQSAIKNAFHHRPGPGQAGRQSLRLQIPGQHSLEGVPGVRGSGAWILLLVRLDRIRPELRDGPTARPESCVRLVGSLPRTENNGAGRLVEARRVPCDCRGCGRNPNSRPSSPNRRRITLSIRPACSCRGRTTENNFSLRPSWQERRNVARRRSRRPTQKSPANAR